MIAPCLFSFVVLCRPVQAPAPSDAVKFARVFKAGDSTKYGLQFSFSQVTITCEVQGKVLELKGDTAKVQFTTTNIKTPQGAAPAVAPFTSNDVGPTNLPGDLSQKIDNPFFMFVALSGVTPNAQAAAGQTVTLDWQNDGKDMKIGGKGLVKTLDMAGHKITVDWDLAMTSPGANGNATFKATSTYSTDDFSLIHSEASLIAGPGQTIKLVVNKH